MTTLSETDVTCAICGNTSTFTSIGSTNAVGSPDLDTRPPEMERSTIYHWVQQCPGCGFCAYDISECADEIRLIVELRPYQDILIRSDLPDTATSFMAMAFIHAQRQQYAHAAWEALHAAWICDDAHLETLAQQFRQQALAHIDQAREHQQLMGEQVGFTEAISLDLLRRSGQFEKGQQLITAIDKTQNDEIINEIIEFQAQLLRQKDTQAHQISEAIGT